MGDVDIRISADTREGQAAINQLVAVQGKLASSGRVVKRSLEDIEKSSAKMGRGGQQASSGIAQQFGALAGKAAGLAAAVRFVTSALQTMRDHAKRGAEEIKNLQESNRFLSQVAVDSPDRIRLRRQAQELSLREGLSINQSSNLLGELKSQGLEKDQRLFASAQPVIDPAVLAQAVGGLKSSFGEGAGSSREVINQFLFAAGKSNFRADKFAALTKVPAQSAKAIGGSLTETLGVLGGTTAAFKGETGADRLSNFLQVIQQKDQQSKFGLKFGQKAGPQLGGGGIIEAVKRVAALSERERFGVLGGNKEATQFFEFAKSNIPQLEALVQGTGAEGARTGKNDLFAQKRGTEFQIKGVKEITELNRSKAREAIAFENENIKEINRQRSDIDRRTEAKLGGSSQFAIGANELVVGALDKLGVETGKNAQDRRHETNIQRFDEQYLHTMRDLIAETKRLSDAVEHGGLSTNSGGE